MRRPYEADWEKECAKLSSKTKNLKYKNNFFVGVFYKDVCVYELHESITTFRVRLNSVFSHLGGEFKLDSVI